MINSQSTDKQIISEINFVWKECLKVFKDNVTLMTYNTWFLPIKPLELENKTLKVQLPSQFFWEWIDEHFNTLINKTIHHVLGPEAKLAYIINEDETSQTQFSSRPAAAHKTPEKIKQKNFESHLNPRYKFENFIKGEGNQ